MLLDELYNTEMRENPAKAVGILKEFFGWSRGDGVAWKLEQFSNCIRLS